MHIRVGIAALVIAAAPGYGTGCLRAPVGSPSVSDPGPDAPTKPGGTPADSFARSIKPMLARSCTPCHVPGGKMYDRLPFDDPNVVRSHLESILRRLKATEDRTLLEDWAKLPAPPH